MSINIKLEMFEGPLDLLLHLIKKSEVDIYDIPIAEITEQYISYLKAMEELDLEIASEFLVMASTLLEIKSKMLLPKVNISDNEESADIDPRKELVEKLVEYKKYKEFAERLKEFEKCGAIFFKSPEIIDDIENKDVYFKNITVENLMTAYKRVIKTYENRFNKRSEIPKDIDYDEFRIEDKMDYIKNMVYKYKRVSFEKFFENAKSKLEIVVTFLAMLELIKLRFITAIQYKNFEEIIIEGQDELWKIS
ncbi:condensin subunit ScpA [Caloramator quimbayensis]|uniref:Segregation and condensation protein A n=1 Tax=Caloramator quimbayensis TaxID=1147123 RepID=A0A1T4X074_9CLOT|nr:segregation/condensation protein A [Caloramator quimbayensis]SKA82261.1 condensin subunit ScpA [Caloramator quimbayensis]